MVKYDKKNIGQQGDYDINGDGKVNVADVVEMVNRIKNAPSDDPKKDIEKVETLVKNIMSAK